MPASVILATAVAACLAGPLGAGQVGDRQHQAPIVTESVVEPGGQFRHGGFQRGDVVLRPALGLTAQIGQFGVVEVMEMVYTVGWLLAFQLDDDAPGQSSVRQLASLHADHLRTERRE
jgi:hypothetical protein